jgi:methyl-accepting chemotaxis protein
LKRWFATCKVDRFVETFARFKDAYPELLRLHGSERWKQDAWLVRNEVMPLLEQATTDMHRLSTAQQRLIEGSAEDLLSSARRTSVWVLGLTVAGVLVTMLVGWTLARAITRPIRAASDAMARIAGGDGDLTRRLQAHTGDELGELVTNFNAFATRIHDLVKATARSTNAVIASVAITNENASRIAEHVLAQHQDADRLAEEIRTMVATIAESERLATDGSASATSAVADASSGRAIVERTAASIQQLGQHLEAAAAAITTLNQDTQAIGGVLEVISGIAEQTNLLALNAAIEAARAGDSGRGFAVVASEVRNLANRTRESTGEIAEMIVRLQQSAQATKTRMANGHAMAQQSVTHSGDALGALNRITDTVERLRESNQTIAEAAERQHVSIEHIRATVERVSTASSHTAREAEQTTDAAARLGDAAAELQALVGKFKLAGSDALDFEAAKSAHLSWRARIRSFLDGRGSLTRAEALSHRECVLGRWFYGPGLKQYGHLEGMRALEAPHKELHSVIGQIVELKNQGNHMSAEQKYNDLIDLSAKIVARLDALEESLSGPKPPATLSGQRHQSPPRYDASPLHQRRAGQ